jgi:hypothetical protein
MQRLSALEFGRHEFQSAIRLYFEPLRWFAAALRKTVNPVEAQELRAALRTPRRSLKLER